jgi:hypothetical protein
VKRLTFRTILATIICGVAAGLSLAFAAAHETVARAAQRPVPMADEDIITVTPTATPDPLATATATLSATITPSATVTATPTLTATPTPPATATPTLSATITPSATVTATPTGDDDGFPGTLPESHPVAARIAAFFGVPEREVLDLHARGFGFGEIARAYFLARELAANGNPSDDLSVAQIIARRQSGQGWGNIIKSLGLPSSNSGRNLGLIMSGRGTPGAPTATPTTGQPGGPAAQGRPGGPEDDARPAAPPRTKHADKPAKHNNGKHNGKKK